MRKQLRAKYKAERDKARKEERLLAEAKRYSYDNTFTFENMLHSYQKCLKGVTWKASVQRYYLTALTKIYGDLESLENRILPNVVSGKNTIIVERGKQRIITPIHIKDRVIQKCLCDYALLPILAPKLIYDNGASLKGKGVGFTRNRLKYLLRKAIKEYGSDFYVLQYDFKSYFDSVPHSTCRRILQRYIKDEDVVNVTMDVIKSTHLAQIRRIKDKDEKEEQLRKLYNDELCGMCLGSQVSQVMALIVANPIDHYVKDTMRRKYYIRYMDDGVVFAKTKEELQEIRKGIEKICDELGLKLNAKKTHITKVRKGFTFLKFKYNITDTGRIVMRLHHSGIVRMRRKLKKFKIKVENGEMQLDDVYASMQSWMAHAKLTNSNTTIRNMLILYRDLFGGYRLKKECLKYIGRGKAS